MPTPADIVANPGICYIVGAGAVSETIEPGPSDYVIAADGGYRHLEGMGVRADVLMGDFDSLAALPEGIPARRFDAEKDDTDMMLAVKTGLELGFRRFALYGGLGERLDHTLANIQALCHLSRRGAIGFLVGEGLVLTALTDAEFRFCGMLRGVVSVFCMGDRARGVTIEGLKYPLRDAELTLDMPLGVSNEFTGEPARVSVRRGTLLILWHQSGFSPAGAFDGHIGVS